MTITPNTLKAIGNTPLVKLNKMVPAGSAEVFVKLEYFNPTGSYKDRMALSMIEEAEKRGDLQPGMTVVEYTGGSTGSSLAFVCAVKGYRFKVVSSDAFALEKLNTMWAFGADLTLIKSDGGKQNKALFDAMVAKAAEFTAEDGTYWTNQLNNLDGQEGHKVMGAEILEQTAGQVDAFCVSVGTAAVLMGVSKAFKAAGCPAKITALEPASSPILTKGERGSHHVEGIGIGYKPPLLDDAFFDDALAIDESVARETARRMAREEGIFAGISSGLNVAGALEIAKNLGEGHRVVTVACDTGLKYLAGDLYTV